MKRWMLLLSLTMLVMLPAGSMAAQVEGTIQGFTCVTQGKVCPVDMEDPVIAAERLFVVLTHTGDYYFIPNLDRAILARHIRQLVRVTGTINEKYRSMEASSLEINEEGKWRQVWSKEMEEKWRKELGVGKPYQ